MGSDVAYCMALQYIARVHACMNSTTLLHTCTPSHQSLTIHTVTPIPHNPHRHTNRLQFTPSHQSLQFTPSHQSLTIHTVTPIAYNSHRHTNPYNSHRHTNPLQSTPSHHSLTIHTFTHTLSSHRSGTKQCDVPLCLSNPAV